MIYLMHGVGGHQLNMIERFSTPDILNKLIGEGKLPECIVVFIDGYNSFYYDGPGLAMETAIIQDLIPFIDANYNTLATKEGRMIGGISMGGYGAARFALKYPEMFSTALLLSPAVWQNAQGNVCSSLHLFNNFDQATWDAEHPLAFLDSYAETNSPVNFYVIHGTEDVVCPLLMWSSSWTHWARSLLWNMSPTRAASMRGALGRSPARWHWNTPVLS